MAHSRFIHSGQERLQGKGMLLGGNFLKAFRRPFLSDYPKEEFSKEANSYIMNFCEQSYEEIVSDVFTKLHIDRIHTKVLKANPIITRMSYKVCRCCFMLFGEYDASHADMHFCSNPNLDRKNIESNLLEDSNLQVKSYLSKQVNSLSENQRHFLFSVRDKENKFNYFLTGCAGSGKSFTLLCTIYALRLEYGDRVVGVVAPTKIAASIVNGVTIHSFFGIENTPLQKKELANMTDKLRNSNRVRLIKEYLR